MAGAVAGSASALDIGMVLSISAGGRVHFEIPHLAIDQSVNQ